MNGDAIAALRERGPDLLGNSRAEVQFRAEVAAPSSALGRYAVRTEHSACATLTFVKPFGVSSITTLLSLRLAPQPAILQHYRRVIASGPHPSRRGSAS
jgi:hypothetical protein